MRSRALLNTLAAGVLVTLVACNDTTANSQPTTSTSAAPATSAAANTEIPAECNDLPLRATDLLEIMNTTITSATATNGSVGEGGGMMSACYYTTTGIRFGGTAQDKRVVGVTLIKGDNGAYWNKIKQYAKNRVSAGIGDESIASTGSSLPDVTFRMGQWIIGVGFLAETGSPEGQDLVRKLAQRAHANALNR